MMAFPILVPLIGLPGVGKSTFSRKLTDYVQKCNLVDIGRVIIFYLNYDKFLPIIDSDLKSENATKLFRKAAVFTVDSVLSALSTDDFSTKSSVSELLDITRQFLQDICKTEPPTLEAAKRVLSAAQISDSFQADVDAEHPTLILILLDDNNIYRSMRYEYFQLARKHRVSFLQLFFKAPLSLAKARDALRDPNERVGNDVIDKMGAKMERPDADAYRWERRSCVIAVFDEDGEGLGSDGGYDPEQPSSRNSTGMPHSRNGRKFSDLQDGSLSQEFDIRDLQRIIKLFSKYSLEEAVQPSPIPGNVTAEEREKDRQASLMSVLHQSDVKLRSLVSQRLKEVNTRGCIGKETIKVEAVKLAKLKASIYGKLKSGEVELNLEDLHSELELFFHAGL